MAGEDGRIVIKTAIDDQELKAGLGSLSSTIKTGITGATQVVTAFTAAAAAATGTVIKLASDTAEQMDRIDKLSQKTGLSREAFQEWDFILSQSGASVEGLQNAIKNLSVAADEGSDKQVSAFERLGVSVTDANGKIKSQEQLFTEVFSALSAYGDETERTSLASTLLGKAATELAPALNAGADAIEEMREKAHSLGLVVGDEVIDAGVAFTDTMDQIKRTLSALTSNAMGPMMEVLNDLGQSFLGVVTGAEGASEAFQESIGSTVSRVTSIIADSLPTLVDTGMTIVTTLVSGIVQAVPAMAESANELLRQLVSAAGQILPQMVKVGVELILSLIDGAVAAIPELITASVDIVLAFLEAMIEALPKIMEKGPDIIIALIDGIYSALPQLIEAAPKLIISLITGLIQSYPQLISKGPEIVKAMADGIISSIKTMIDVGKELVAGMAKGIKDSALAPVEAIKETGEKIVSGVKGFFGIRSPSRVMMEIGEYLSLGISKGIKQKDGTVISAAQAQAEGIENVYVALSKEGVVLGAAVTEELAQGILDGQDGAVNAALDTVQKIGTAFSGVGRAIEKATEKSFTSFLKGMEGVGKAIVEGKDAWGSLGKSALTAIASIVESLGHELAARAVASAVSFNWVGASLATAGAAAAYTASGMIKSWANSFAVGGIVPAQSGVSTTGDQTVIYANPGELILNAAQQTNVARQLEALAKINELVGPSSGGSLSIGVAFNGPVFGDQEAISRYVYDGIKRAQWEGVLKQW